MQVKTITKLLCLSNFEVLEVVEHQDNNLHLYIDLVNPAGGGVPVQHVAPFTMVQCTVLAGFAWKTSRFVAGGPFSMYPNARFFARLMVKSGSNCWTHCEADSPGVSLITFID